MIRHIKGIASAAYSGRKKEFCENSDAAAPYSSPHDSSSRILCTSLQGSNNDKRPAIHNICSAVHFNTLSTRAHGSDAFPRCQGPRVWR